jgi:hypothetical protein
MRSIQSLLILILLSILVLEWSSPVAAQEDPHVDRVQRQATR